MKLKRAWGSEIQTREERFELKRQAVLATAAQMFRKQGFDRVSLADIALELHVSKPTVYYYFRNKEELLRELFDTAIAEFLDPQINPEDYPQVPGLPGAERLERFVRRGLRTVMSDIGSSCLITPFHYVGGPMRDYLVQRGKPVDSMAQEILADGVRDGSLRIANVPATYRYILGAMNYIPSWIDGHAMSQSELTESFVQFVMRGLKP